MNILLQFKLKLVCLMLVFLSPAFCLQAPFLISVTALNESSIQISWRNNDINSEGFIIKRLDSSEQKFNAIDTIDSSTVLSFIDTKSIHPLTFYSYQVIAFQGTNLSDTSNRMETTTPGAKLQKGAFVVEWNCDFSKYPKLVIIDSSKSEKGYHIYRKDEASPTFSKIIEIVSRNPFSTDSIIAYDSSVSNNKMFDYYAVAYNQTDSLIVDTVSIFTYHEVYPSSVKKLSKVSEYPISSGGWSARAGDSVILKENNSPADKYTVINIRTPENPEFKGYIDSSTLMTYQANTLIPFFLKYGVSNSSMSQNVIFYNNYLLVKTNSDSLNMYKHNGTEYSFQSTFPALGISKLFRVNDLLIYSHNSQYNFSLSSYQYSILHIHPSGRLRPLSTAFENRSRSGMGASGYLEHTIMGVSGETNLVIGIDEYYLSAGTKNCNHWVAIYNTAADQMTKMYSDDYLSETINTGFYISKDEFIGLHSKNNILELFVSPISNTRGYRIAAWNNSIYKDSTINQSML